MIDFLTTIYDRKFYDVKTKNKGDDTIKNPNVVFLSCETPEWIRFKLKDQIISGGFSRRMIWVFEKREKRIPFPRVTDEMKNAYVRCREHLQKMWSVVGEFKWEDEAKEWYTYWYNNIKPPEDPLMEGFYESIHIQLLKVSMLLALCDPKFPLLITKPLLELGLEQIERIIPSMSKLAEGSGADKLSQPKARMLEIINANGGFMPEMTVKKIMGNDLIGRPYDEVKNHLIQTQELYTLNEEVGGVKRWFLATADGVINLKNGLKGKELKKETK